MATTKIILQGGGGHARVVLDCLLSQGAAVVGIFDPKYTGHMQPAQNIRLSTRYIPLPFFLPMHDQASAI
mgnify:CR=1 FL=1